MDKRYKRNEASDKKTDNKIIDRGDLKKANDKVIKKSNENTQVEMKVTAYPDRGDSERKIQTNQKPEKMRINIVVKKPANGIDGAPEKEFSNKKINDKEGQKPCDLELRKRIRDKYTLKLKTPVIKSTHSNLLKKDDGGKAVALKSDSKNVDRPKKQLAEETTQTKEKFLNHSSNSSEKTELNLDKKPEKNTREEKNTSKPDRNSAKPIKPERNSVRRKPIIKTIMSKNGAVRIYKAVTFVDQRRSPTPLEINIPGDALKKQKVSKFTDTSSLKFKTKLTVSRASIKEKPIAVRKKMDRRKDYKKSRHVPSRDTSVEVRSPPTEVARWAPACIDRHTKPYYEAWVDTTLAAISKNSKKDKLFYKKQRESILKSFQRAFEERPWSPELFYENFADEKYTGRIKITQR